MPSALDAAQTAASVCEPRVPRGWPGTYCPNFSAWRRGDIVLVHGDRNIGGRIIRIAQRTSRNPLSRSGWQVTHAGIHAGDGMQVDARVRQPVSKRSTWEYCRTRQSQVRRLRNDRSLPATAGDDIAAAASGHIDEPYSVLAAIVSKLMPGTKPVRQSLYCSTLVGLVVANATGVDLSSDPAHRPLHPAVLVGHPDLEDVLLEWRQL